MTGASEAPERRLAVILAADAVGYSRLMGADDEGTLKVLNERRQIFRETRARGRGRIVDTAGDSVFAEFTSAVEAVRCATGVQRRIAERNADLDADRQMAFRIGVSRGDVLAEGGALYGDGVNVAARLQAMAAPGGICVSRPVFEQVEGKLEIEFEDLGPQSVKNIARPVQVYQVIGGASHGRSAVSEARAESLDDPLSSRPSIAVLPFNNLSGDPEQEFFADGITEDIITELSRFRSLFVIARNSSFAYKGRALNVTEVAQELGVRYVAEGSVRKAGNRVRVTVQLIEAATGSHVWAERYDRELEDIFAIQDEVTQAMVATLPGRLEAADLDRAERKPPENLAAYECVLTGKILHHRSIKKDPAYP